MSLLPVGQKSEDEIQARNGKERQVFAVPRSPTKG